MTDSAENILVLTTGGTLDKIYFDAKSEFEVGNSIVGRMLEQAHVHRAYKIIELMRKDSLELTDQDRRAIVDEVQKAAEQRVVITHGTDTMTETATALASAVKKTIVLTGALAPARFAETDAMFNLGMAFAAAQVMPAGIYIVMNGCIFEAGTVRKDREKNAFVSI